jgi:phytoene dehydrogenase-like protein
LRDVLIIGGGHNGLVCAAYLAAAGLGVTVLERRGVVGGAAVTEEFHPGFRNSVAAYTVSLLNPKVIGISSCRNMVCGWSSDWSRTSCPLKTAAT